MKTLPPLPARPRLRVLSLSSPSAAECPRRYARALEHARRWFDVSEGRFARSKIDHRVAPARDRARDVIDAWDDPTVDVLWSVIGGQTTAQILDELPLARMAEKPKLVLGYSDTTSLFAALACHGIPSLHGAALLPQFGEFDGPHPYTLDALRRALRPEPLGRVPESEDVLDEVLAWEVADTRARRRRPEKTRRCLVEGAAEGWLFVANLGTLLTLAGTRYLPDLGGAILVIEEDETENSESIERLLTQARMTGLFRGIHGLIVGRLPDRVGMAVPQLAAAVRRATSDVEIPIALGLEVGHVDPFHALPIGAASTMEASTERVDLTVTGTIYAGEPR